jgi:hypothetical protein
MHEVSADCGVIADTDSDGAGKNDRTNRGWENPANPLPDDLTRRKTPATGTRHELSGVVPAGLDKPVDVLEKADRAFAFRHRATRCVRDPTARRSRRASCRDPRLSPVREPQENERPSGVH